MRYTEFGYLQVKDHGTIIGNGVGQLLMDASVMSEKDRTELFKTVIAPAYDPDIRNLKDPVLASSKMAVMGLVDYMCSMWPGLRWDLNNVLKTRGFKYPVVKRLEPRDLKEAIATLYTMRSDLPDRDELVSTIEELYHEYRQMVKTWVMARQPDPVTPEWQTFRDRANEICDDCDMPHICAEEPSEDD